MQRNKKFKNKITSGGYTIIETMIAISLFKVVTTLGLGALLNAHRLHNKTGDMRSIMDNLSFIMEDMSRNLRTGYNYHCVPVGQENLPEPAPAQSCVSGYGLVFEEATGNPASNSDQWVYYVSGGKLYKSINGVTPSSIVQLTPDEVIITSTTPFSVLGAESPTSGNSQQPFVIIRLAGTITFQDVTTPFSIQTAVSQRSVDI